MEFAGPRGKSSFAKQLELSPSTYDYYEAARVPPADVLVKIADLTGVDLRWLLTGEESSRANQPAVPANHPAVQRVAELLSRHPEAAKPLAAFLDILSATMQFPDSKIPAEQNPTTHESANTKTEKNSPTSASAKDQANPNLPSVNWIPVLGRSAAGVPHFWTESEQAARVTTLGQLVNNHAAEVANRAEHTPATQSNRTASGQSTDEAVQLIRLPEPLREDGPTEYVSASTILEKIPDAFAVWIDGDSMSPEIRHGDLVLLSPSAPAEAGKAAVVQIEGAIGVTCKLYHPSGSKVHLVPINEQFPPATAETDQIQWSLKVLARIRLAGR